MYFNQVYNNEYDDSGVDKWLNETYLSKFPSAIKQRVNTTSIKSVKQGSTTAITILKKVFLLSATELGSNNIQLHYKEMCIRDRNIPLTKVGSTR